jgi:TPR repeat protein
MFVTQAFEFYKIAAEKGNEPAKEAVRRLEVNLRPMEELEAKAEELKDPEQQFQVGRRYHNGLNCPQNIPRAIEWYERAVNQGHAGAANNLGVVFDNGPGGIDKNYERAFHYFSIGASRGSNVGMKNLGIMHEDGRPGVVPKDKILSLEWYGRAAVAGNDYAKERLGVLLGRAEYPIFLRALNQDPEAAFDVAKKWEAGAIYPQSFVKAAEFYEKAATRKHAPAANALANLYAQGHIPVAAAAAVNPPGPLVPLAVGAAGAPAPLAVSSPRGDGAVGAVIASPAVPGSPMAAGNPAEGSGGASGQVATPAAPLTPGGDVFKAFKFWQQAADAGHAEAMFHLAEVYENGRERITADPVLAVEWYLFPWSPSPRTTVECGPAYVIPHLFSM